ncbi:hypothetical protein QJS66_11100 [Kocuria rhizophila]|nr:hypothetical protein QJS66_11100 [Kocuria rhizophila]
MTAYRVPGTSCAAGPVRLPHGPPGADAPAGRLRLDGSRTRSCARIGHHQFVITHGRSGGDGGVFEDGAAQLAHPAPYFAPCPFASPRGGGLHRHRAPPDCARSSRGPGA